jgi:hypothetical protein
LSAKGGNIRFFGDTGSSEGNKIFSVSKEVCGSLEVIHGEAPVFSGVLCGWLWLLVYLLGMREKDTVFIGEVVDAAEELFHHVGS